MQRSSVVARELQEALADFEHVCFDLSGVDSIDLMGLQLLLAAQVTQHSKGRTLSYASASAAVRELCAVLGLSLGDC
jgi:anti-anti-sigma regulatory factor